MKMPFGRYQGQEIEDVPDAYFKRLIGLMAKDGATLYGQLAVIVYAKLNMPLPIVEDVAGPDWHPADGLAPDIGEQLEEPGGEPGPSIKQAEGW